ncbi:MAG: PASTA domain-containing protein, partial [Sulfobacillus sp.]
MPNLIQEPLHVAYSDLVAVGLKLGHITYVPSIDLSGTVVSQTPGPGSKLAEGTTVALQVSKGNANLVLTMPNVVGEPVQTAANQLGAIGLQMQVTAFAASASPDGTVLDQSVAAG